MNFNLTFNIYLYISFFENAIFFTEKKKFGNFVEEDPDLLESLGKSSKRRKSTHKNLAPIDEDDDDFSPTVKERDRKRAEKRREAAKRVRNLRL